MDYLLDSNWLVTLNSIIIAFYIFVLSLPIIIQQAFLPEEVREVYNQRNISYKNSELADLKDAGLLAVIFIFLFGNPAWKYLLIKFVLPSSLELVSLIIHLAGFISFIIVISEFYKFVKKHFFNYSSNDTNLDLGIALKTTISNKKFAFTSNKIKQKTVGYVVNDMLNTYRSSGFFQMSDINDMVVLGKSFQLNVDKGYLLEGVKILVKEAVNSETHFYDGAKLENVIQNILEEIICRNSDMCSEDNFVTAREITSIIKEKYRCCKDLSTYDSKEVVSFLLKASMILLDKNHKGESESLLPIYINELKSMPNSSISIYKLFKRIFINNHHTLFSTEFSGVYLDYKTKVKSGYSNSIENIVAFLSWFNNKSNVEMKRFASNWITKYKNIGLLNNGLIDQIKDDYFSINEFETACSIEIMLNEHFH